MYCTVLSGAFRGVECCLIQVEADASPGLPCFELVGCLSGEIKEAKERVRVALKNSQIKLPPCRITVNLSPAGLRKEGTFYDLPIAVGILAVLGYLPAESLTGTLVLGELGLGGEVKPVRGVLPMIAEASRQGIKNCIVPLENEKEASIIHSMNIAGVSSLKETILYLTGGKEKRDHAPNLLENFPSSTNQEEYDCDFSEIYGQEIVKRAAEIAAAGFHHMLLTGPPGSGKTMAAKRIPTILPPMSLEESLEVSKIYSIAGLLNSDKFLVTNRPFIHPHHTVTAQALAGGGHVPKPGCITLAHKGVLFLDELPEFSRNVLEILRQPLEEKNITIARSHGNTTFPSDFMMVAAMNPCPCGYYPDLSKCTCREDQIRRYLGKISGPILDRIDLCVEVSRQEIPFQNAIGTSVNKTSGQMRENVMRARKMQNIRYENTPYRFNAGIKAKDVEKYCKLGAQEEKFMQQVFTTLKLSLRSYHRILKVARTIADLEGEENLTINHLAEASAYRNMRESRGEKV